MKNFLSIDQGTTSILINLRKTSPPNERRSIIGSANNEGIEIIPKNKPKIIPDTKLINIFSVKLFFIMVPSTGYAPVAESYQDPVLLLN